MSASSAGNQTATSELSTTPSQELILKLEEQYLEKEAVWKGR